MSTGLVELVRSATEVRQRTAQYAGHTVPANRAVVGSRLFTIESGIVAGFMKRCGATRPTELFPYVWSRNRARALAGGRWVDGRGRGIDGAERVEAAA